MTRLLINNEEYPLDDGIIVNDKKTEELNSAVVSIGFVDRLNLSSFDKAEIIGDTIGHKYYLIDTWTNITASFEPLKYTYNIALISEAIQLQKIIMPNVGITQPIGIEQKTIRKKLEEYYEVFIAPQYPHLVLSQELLDLTNDVIAPEHLFGRPTLYEVINALLIKIGCCADIINNQITYKRLDDYGEEIDQSKLHYENDTQNINEYANRLDIEVENAISKETNYSTPAGITVRAESGAILNDENMEIVLDKPIYDIDQQSVFVYVETIKTNDIGATNAQTYKRKYDITDYIVEKSVYDTYLTSNAVGTIKDKGYKRNALYYVAGDNKIQGLTYTEKSWIQLDAPIALYNILKNVVETDYSLTFGESDVRDNVFFKVEYKTSDRFRLTVEKENDYNATLIDNQNETQIEAETFGKVEQDKLNRFGNKEIIITATYRNGEKIPELGDYIDKYVLAQREIVYYDDFALFKGYLYKNFVRKNMFYGLNSKKRFTQISDENVVRNEVINYDLTFSSSEPNDEYQYLKRFMLQPLANYSYTGEIYPEFAKYMLFKFKDKNDNDIVEKGYVLLTSSAYACGKSNVLSIRMPDNYSAGIQVSGNATGGKLQRHVRYVDNYGEFKSFDVEVRSNRKDDFFENGTGNVVDFENFKPIADSLPYISDYNRGSLNSNYLLSDSKLVYKDNRESLALSLNLNFKDTEEVIIGNISAFSGVVIDKASDLKFCYSTTDIYEIGDTKGLGEPIDMVIDTANAVAWYENGTLFGNILIIVDSITGTQGWKSYGILDKDGNLILGVNSVNGSNPSRNLYLHVSKKEY